MSFQCSICPHTHIDTHKMFEGLSIKSEVNSMSIRTQNSNCSLESVYTATVMRIDYSRAVEKIQFTQIHTIAPAELQPLCFMELLFLYTNNNNRALTENEMRFCMIRFPADSYRLV